MPRVLPLTLLLALPLACFKPGDDGDEIGSDTDTDSGTTDEESTDSGSTDSTTDDTSEATDSSETDPSDTTDTTEDTTDTTDGSACQVWEITYDLTNSEFEISGTPLGQGDQVNVVQEPYDDDENIGPGNLVMRFHDVGGAPGGQAFITSYAMDIHFVVDGNATITTDLVTDAGPDECGVAFGMLEAGTVPWDPATIAGMHTVGTILCEGLFGCNLGGLPDGMPVLVDDTTDQPINPFQFSADLTSFSMAPIVIANDDQSTTSWTYVGTQTSRELVGAPACLCE
jgi:hypothetical protein